MKISKRETGEDPRFWIAYSSLGLMGIGLVIVDLGSERGGSTVFIVGALLVCCAALTGAVWLTSLVGNVHRSRQADKLEQKLNSTHQKKS